MKFSIPASVILLMAACAPSPDSIEAKPVSEDYADVSCRQAANYLADQEVILEDLSEAQEKTVAADAAGVFLFGIPGGSLAGGNHEEQIALTKGRIAALEARLEGC